jgi:spore germination protein D
LRKFIYRLLAFSLSLVIMAGCSGQSSTQGNTPDYQATKKMVIDMLKSDDGKKAVQDILSEDAFKKQLVINQDVVKKTITETLTSDKGKKFWEGLLKDPDFSKVLATSMQKNNEQLLKQLMKDPEYQGMLMDVFKAPNMEKEYLELLQTKPFRAQIQKDILEAVSSPLFSAKLTEALNKTVEEQIKKGGSSKGGQSGGGGS